MKISVEINTEKMISQS